MSSPIYATAFNSNVDGSDDPNDGSESGHGTHAAGTAIGTGVNSH